MNTVVWMCVAMGFGFLLGKGYGPLMMKLLLLPLRLGRRA